ncbi:C-X-C chemokine receptor type 3-like [Pagrus major]|uniref:C-X-C chemokine receptor type 3-like n=1 Tax=Pagrus major TaxID=143350 RepID=UPI003CC8532E
MMNMEVDLDGIFRENGTIDYDEDYVYEDDETRAIAWVLMPVLYSVQMVIGLLGNGLLLAVLAQNRRSWSMSDTFILHLSVADVLLLLVTLPIWAAQADQRCEWCFNDFLCKISGAVFNINFYCGIFMLVCISLDCYLSVIHATQLYSQKRPRLAHISCFLVWLGSLILSIADSIFTVGKKDHEKMCVHKYFVSRLGHHTLGFLLPAAALIICCSFILLRLQRSSKGLQKQRAVMVILHLVGVFFLCWMPYNITLIVDTVRRSSKEADDGTPESSLRTALTVTSVFGCVHACLRPLLYLGLCQNFRKRILALLRCAPAKSVGSLWELGVGEEVLPDQNHEVGESEPMSVDHQVQSTQC